MLTNLPKIKAKKIIKLKKNFYNKKYIKKTFVKTFVQSSRSAKSLWR